MLTPQEVAEHGFSKSRMGGYNMKEVDDFLDELTADFSELYKENSVLKGKIKVLAEKISEYRETEDAMRTTLLTAQKMANSMVVQAEEEKKRMIAEAERAALQRKAEVEQEVADAEYQLKMAKNATAQFVEGMRELVKQESAFLDQLPAIKAEPIHPRRQSPSPPLSRPKRKRPRTSRQRTRAMTASTRSSRRRRMPNRNRQRWLLGRQWRRWRRPRDIGSTSATCSSEKTTKSNDLTSGKCQLHSFFRSLSAYLG